MNLALASDHGPAVLSGLEWQRPLVREGDVEQLRCWYQWPRRALLTRVSAAARAAVAAVRSSVMA